MSREGSSSPAPVVDGSGLRVCLISARFNDRIVDALVGSIYATDTDRASLAEVPQLAALAESRSLLLAARRAAAAAGTATAASAPVSEAETEPEQTTEEAPAAAPQSSLVPADDAGEQPSEAVAAAGQDETGLLLPVSSLATESAATKPEEDGLSEFDKVVMRAFGMLDESQLTEEAKSAESSASIVDLASMQQQSGEGEDKPDEEGELGVPDVVVEEEIDDTSLTEEEKRNDARVEEATRELTDDTEEAESPGGGGGNSSPNTVPVLGSISGLAFSDTSSDDSFTNETGALTATDSDSGDVLTYSISGGSANNGLAGYDLARSGSYGTLYLNSSTGAYAYVPNDSAIEGAKTSVSESFTLAVSDGAASATQTLTTSIESAWADARAASEQSVAQEASLVAAERAFLNTEKRYEAGASTAIDYADARTLYDNARVNALRAKYDLAFKSRILDFYMGKAMTFR